MNFFSEHKRLSLFLSVFAVLSFAAAFSVHSMHPYNADPEVRALGGEAAEKVGEKKVDAGELTGDALRDKVLADPKSVPNGQLRFAQFCTAYCHGDKGSGGDGPTLQCQEEYTAEYLAAVIAEGRRSGSRVMPSWKESINEHDRWELVAFILSLKDMPHCDK